MRVRVWSSVKFEQCVRLVLQPLTIGVACLCSSISIMGGKKFQTKFKTVADVYGEAFSNKWHMQASIFTNERKEECFERGTLDKEKYDAPDC